MQDETIIDKKRKRSLFIIFMAIVMAAFCGLTVVNYLERDIPEIILNLLVIALMAAGLIALNTWNRDAAVYRVVHFFTCLLLLYGVMMNIGKGTVLYWVLIMPLLFFYFFGKKEGLLWTIIFSTCISLILLAHSLFGAPSYSPAIISRLLIILAILVIIGYSLESSRDTYSRLLIEKNNDLLREKERLEQAAKEIRTLNGLIPICCHCKKIRDDQGYWQQVEIYVRERTEADFSHGICPECAEKYYSDYKKPTDT